MTAIARQQGIGAHHRAQVDPCLPRHGLRAALPRGAQQHGAATRLARHIHACRIAEMDHVARLHGNLPATPACACRTRLHRPVDLHACGVSAAQLHSPALAARAGRDPGPLGHGHRAIARCDRHSTAGGDHLTSLDPHVATADPHRTRLTASAVGGDATGVADHAFDEPRGGLGGQHDLATMRFDDAAIGHQRHTSFRTAPDRVGDVD